MRFFSSRRGSVIGRLEASGGTGMFEGMVDMGCSSAHGGRRRLARSPPSSRGRRWWSGRARPARAPRGCRSGARHRRAPRSAGGRRRAARPAGRASAGSTASKYSGSAPPARSAAQPGGGRRGAVGEPPVGDRRGDVAQRAGEGQRALALGGGEAARCGWTARGRRRRGRSGSTTIVDRQVAGREPCGVTTRRLLGVLARRSTRASGATIVRSLATTVVTPSKCPTPRCAPSSVSVSGPRTVTVVAKPSG